MPVIEKTKSAAPAQTAGLPDFCEVEVIRDDDKNNFHIALFTMNNGDKEWAYHGNVVVGDKAAMNKKLADYAKNYGLKGWHSWWVVDGKRTSSFKQPPTQGETLKRDTPEPVESEGYIENPIVAIVAPNNATEAGILLELRADNLPQPRYKRALDQVGVEQALKEWSQVYNLPVEAFTVVDERSKADEKRKDIAEKYSKTGEIGKSAPPKQQEKPTPENYGTNTSVWKWSTCTGFAVTVASKRHVGYDVIEHTAHYEGIVAEGIEPEAVIDGVIGAFIKTLEGKLDEHAEDIRVRLMKEAEEAEPEGPSDG